MKKLATLLLAAGLVFSAANSASAVEVKVSGMMDFAFEGYQNVETPFTSHSNLRRNLSISPTTSDSAKHQKYGGAVQRFRLGMDFIVSESLSAHYQLQVGDFTWGGTHRGNGAQAHRALGGELANNHASNLTTHLVYLDWMVPSTDVKVRMGYQPVSLPSFTFGSPLLDNRGSGIVVTVPVNENITITPMWVRANAGSRRGPAKDLSQNWEEGHDVFALIADFKYDGFRVAPWAGYSTFGKDSGRYSDGASVHQGRVFLRDANGKILKDANGNIISDGGDTWMGGISAELSAFDPFRFTADFAYASTDTDHFKAAEMKGWYAMLGAEYKLPAYGVLGLKGWYASGDDNDASDGSERIPSQWAAFNATTTYFDGAFGIANNYARGTIGGTWGVQVSWTDISFIDKLSHDFKVTYVSGTNHRNQAAGHDGPWEYLTKKDNLIEFDLDTTYNIYQNLAAVLELAYVMEDFSGTTWGRAYGTTVNGQPAKAQFNDMWRAALNFRYTF